MMTPSHLLLYDKCACPMFYRFPHEGSFSAWMMVGHENLKLVRAKEITYSCNLEPSLSGGRTERTKTVIL